MKKMIIAIAIALPLAFSGIAAASPGGSLSPKESDCARAKRLGKVCQISFGTGDDVEGKIAGPNGDDVLAFTDALFGGLIRLRTDFRAEIIASLDDLD